MPTKTTNRQNAFCDRNMLAIVIEVQNRRTGFRPRRAPHQIEAGALYAVLASAGDGKGRRPFLRAHLGAKNAHARLGAAARPLRVRLKLPRAKNGGMSSCSPAAIRRRLAKRAASKPN